METAQPVGALPRAAWVMAWLFLIGQVAGLMVQGLTRSDPVGVLISVVLTALLTWWFASGVLAARTVRLVIVWILLSAAVALGFVWIAIGGDEVTTADVVTFAFAVAQLVALGSFCSTDYFKERRAGRPASRAAVEPLLLMAVLTGILGGLTAPTYSAQDPSPTHFQIRL
ncbi:hypothetical protein ACLM5J_09175 [Nocardioides sp. Bht2]|uniref:hypothetical protein n=1 Tax=Nocardioides sp. Bht2 TaxID=3392297 RepID=UPI0039B627C4